VKQTTRSWGICTVQFPEVSLMPVPAVDEDVVIVLTQSLLQFLKKHAAPECFS
jgi:hypothetical protein